jgi:hypothetical protein
MVMINSASTTFRFGVIPAPDEIIDARWMTTRERGHELPRHANLPKDETG